jgi:hypothetical protein
MSSRPERHTPFKFSQSCAPTPSGLSPLQFVQELSRVPATDVSYVVRTWMQERSPAAFASTPYLWESAREWLAKRMGVSPREIGLAGSAQLGFSTNPKKALSPFNPNGSDLDLFVVSRDLFEVIEREARMFVARQQSAAKSDFLEQAATTERVLERGYVDLQQIPAKHERYPKVASLRNDTSILLDKLSLSGYKLKASHFRVYRDWQAKSSWTSIQAAEWAKLPQAQ